MIATSMSSKKDTVDHIKTKSTFDFYWNIYKNRFGFSVYLHIDILQISWCGGWKTNLFASIQDFTECIIF